jgi:hypothetical protein
MKAGSWQHFEQSYNAQAAVETGSRLIIAGQVVDAPNDKQELQPTLGTLDPVIESVSNVLIDSGFYSEAAVLQPQAALPHGRGAEKRLKRRAGRLKSGPKSIARRNSKHPVAENTHHVRQHRQSIGQHHRPPHWRSFVRCFKSDRLLGYFQ